jgi:hypothetical protein
MSKGPEANFWNSLRTNLPKNCFATRIENKHGGGVPDVHLVWDGLPFWMELKVANSNAIKLSPHQVAWNMAYWARGGANFFLVKRAKERDILLFGGDQGPAVLEQGCLAPCVLRVDSPASLFCALRPVLEGILRPAP